MNGFSGLIAVVLLFILGNAALYYGQEWYHSADMSRCSVLEKQIDAKKRQFISLELQMESIQDKAKKVESEDEWNRLNDKFTYLQDKYNEIVKSHNSDVDEYNELIKSCSSRWYIIPMPRLGKGKAST